MAHSLAIMRRACFSRVKDIRCAIPIEERTVIPAFNYRRRLFVGTRRSSPGGLCIRRQRRHLTSSPAPPEPPDGAIEAAERGLQILRDSSDDLEQDDAMEALRCLLRGAANSPPSAEVFSALGDLHYIWGDRIEAGRRAQLGAKGAAKAVVAEIKELRRMAIRQRQRAPGSGGIRRPHHMKKDQADSRSSSSWRADRALGVSNVAEGEGSDTCPADMNHPEAWEWYMKAADRGHSRAMMQLGDIALESAGKGAATAEYAEEWYRQAADGNPPQPDALFQLARLYHEGIGVPCDAARARDLYEQACEAGSSAAAYFMGHRLHIGDDELGILADGERALTLLRRASQQGHAEATFFLAQAYRSGSLELALPQDSQQFGKMVQQAASAGSADAMFALGGAYFHGEDGFAQDPRGAFRYYSAAAGLGHADASYCLGVMHYAMGDKQEAFRCYQTAAEGGNMLAWRSLASMYALGEGVTRSEQMAHNIIATFGEQIERQERGGDVQDDVDKPGDVRSGP